MMTPAPESSGFGVSAGDDDDEDDDDGAGLLLVLALPAVVDAVIAVLLDEACPAYCDEPGVVLGWGVIPVVLPLLWLLLHGCSAEVVFSGVDEGLVPPASCEEETIVTVRRVVSLPVNVEEKPETEVTTTDAVVSAGGGVLADADWVSLHGVELASDGTVAVSERVVDVGVVTSVQVVSTVGVAVLFWAGRGGEDADTSALQVVSMDESGGDVRVGLPLGPLLIGAKPLDGWVACQGKVEFGRGKGGADELSVIDGPDVVAVAAEVGPVPDGATLPAVEFGNGNGTELDTTDDDSPDDGMKLTVTPLPVGNAEVAFESGYGGIVAGTLGAVPVPRTPELRGIPDPPVAVLLVKGYGGEELQPVATLVGAVTPALVGKAQPLLELDIGYGAVPRPALPVGPAADEELLMGKGGVWIGVDELLVVLQTVVPRGAVPPAELDELVKGNGGEPELVAETGNPDEGTPVPPPVSVPPGADAVPFVNGNGVEAENIELPELPVNVLVSLWLWLAVPGAVDVFKGSPVADMNVSFVLLAELVTREDDGRGTVLVKVIVVTDVVPLLNVNVLVAVSVMASTLDVPRLEVVDPEFPGVKLEFVPAVADVAGGASEAVDEAPDVAGEVIPAVMDV
ncbi:cf1176b8-b604-4c49-be30-5329c93d29f4 [Thermothielavioides terrestris]|uniref:Cf1176b8-b604-4c49-be30-5329c93d29f4 n=1 Tax=Thermothielavioides terrestris TaxID=2587410 RepID=A0A446BBC6_9PEZI|nr:cf1176b8-b604-4c49-be30-5329c93d29f4 [Thermothielavioides terrestris]